MNSVKRSPDKANAEVSPLEQPIVLAVMGTAGGVGKGMFVWCTADLLSAAGYNVVIVDLDLMARTRTLEAQRLLLNVAPPVRTVYDHFASEAVGLAHMPHTESTALWDVTPGDKDGTRTGTIHVLPSATEQDIQPHAVTSQLPLPQQSRSKAIIHSIIKRVEKELPSTHCIILECGAGHDLHNFAGLANANASFVMLDPREVLFEAARRILKTYAVTYPEINISTQPVFYVLNRYMSDEDIERAEQSGIPLCGMIPHNPVFQKYNITHPANFDAGFDDIYMAVYRTLTRALKRWVKLPGEGDMVNSRWWTGFKREHVAEKTLRSGGFRTQTLLAWALPSLALLGFLSVIVMEIIRYTEARIADQPFQLRSWLLLLLVAVMAGGIRWLVQQERRRRVLRKLEYIPPEEEKRLLEELLRESSKNTINWLNRLYRASQEKALEKK